MNKLELVESKILQNRDLELYLKNLNSENKKVVFTNGCFDIIHRGHVDYLAKAASFGDVLLIGVNTNNSVKRIKGNTRPIQDEYSRALILAAFSFVDIVILFDEDTPYELIKKIQPDILVKGSDYKAEDIVGYDILKAKGGKVITIDFVEGFSTSLIINKIKKEE